MRKLLVVLVVLAALLVVGDRVAVAVAQGVLGTRMQSAGQLSSKPGVRITGFPFLTQALRGSYDQIDVDARDLSRQGVSLGYLHVQVLGARVPLGDALRGNVHDVPVEGLRAQTLVTFVELVRKSSLGLTARPKGDGIEVTGKVTFAGQTFTATATSKARLQGNVLLLRTTSVSVLGAHSSLVDRYVAGLFDLDLKIPALPYGLRLTNAHVAASGVVLDAVSGPTVLRAG